MKVCERHIADLKRGMTYEIVGEEHCEICKAIQKLLDEYEW